MKGLIRGLITAFQGESHTWKKIYILIGLIALLGAINLIIRLVK